MNAYDLHLISNHFPLFGIGLSMAILIAHFVSGNQKLLIAALIMSCITGLIGIPVYLSGEASEDIVNFAPDINTDLLEKHEELAKKGFILLEINFLVSCVFLFLLYKEIYKRFISLLLLILYFSCFLLLVFVNRSGGEIRHPEIREDSLR